MSEPLRVVVPDLAPRYFRILLPLWLFVAFLTGVKFLPGIRNNFGPFEIVGLLMIAAYLFVESRPPSHRRHPIILVTAVIATFALASQLRVPAHRALYGVVQVGIVLFLLFFLVVIWHFLEKYQISPEAILRIIAISVLIVGPWVYLDGVSSGGDIEAAGPFRNRAHMANYMLTAFWLVAAFLQWPGVSKRLRAASYLAAGLALYAVAISGRRSVYLSLFIGLGVWAASFLAANRGRLKLLVSAMLLVSFLGGIYVFSQFLGPQGEFFRERVSMIDDRLRSAMTRDDELFARSFYQLQREGVARAVRDAPIFGIGWGAFAKSPYSPTGHEVHSTPLRFLAELGLVGFVIYAFLIAYLLIVSLRLFLRMKASPYAAVYLVLAVATWTMTVSHLYNRHITERTYWIYLAVFMALELFADRWHQLRGAVVQRLAFERSGPLAVDEQAGSGRAAFERRPQPAGL